MIFRYIVIVLIGLFFVAALLLSKTVFTFPVYSKIPHQIKAASPIEIGSYPIPGFGYKDPLPFTAKSAVVIDAKTNIVLFEKNSNLKHLPASTTKLMTTLVALEQCLPTQIVTITEIEREGTQMGLEIGDRVSVENLLYGLLINSGNDAAFVLAKACSDSPDHFVVSMNRKAKNLGMVDTHFMNPAGFDNNFQYSTALDLAKLANASISNPLISKIVATKSTVVTDAGKIKTYYLENVNELLGVVDGIEGVKTGQTEGSLENLITRTTRGGNSIVVAILGSNDRFGESKQLIEWAFKNYQWVNR